MQDGDVIAVKKGLELSYPLHVDDRGSVHPNKLVGIESAFEVFQGFPQDVMFLAGVNLYVIPRGLDPVDFGDRQKHDSAGVANDQPVEWFARAAHGFEEVDQPAADVALCAAEHLFARTAQRLLKASTVERLEQVVERVYFEGL